MSTPEIPAGLRRASFEVLAPLAAAAPLPLYWTDGASGLAIVLYEIALFSLWRWARKGRPPRLSNTVLNALGLGYLVWLGFEAVLLRHGLLKSVSHLLLFTAIAKLASLKRPGEVRTALLVIFLITLASASSSTHIASLLYFAAMAFLGFRCLARLAVLADFEDGPPLHVIRSVPTGGMAIAAILIGGTLTAPLFYGLPRLRRPFAVAPFRVEDAFSSALTADRVDLASFGAAKRSDQVVLRMEVDPESAVPRVLRLREAVFTRYHRGVWTRPVAQVEPGERAERLLAQTRAQQHLLARLSMDLNLNANGFLFLPYGSDRPEIEGEIPTTLRDGVVTLARPARTARYTVEVRGVEPKAVGSSAIDPNIVPQEVRDFAQRLTGDLKDPLKIYERIQGHFAANFLYTLDPPRGKGDPIVNFLLHSKAGHCEFFASAAAMMLASRGIPSRLVTGSYGGETGLLSRALVVRGANLHAWVEANVDGQGFSVLDPTPPAGIPPASTHVSWKRFFTNLSREIEFFYDRKILGFDSLDQVRVAEALRDTVAGLGRGIASWKEFVGGREARRIGIGILVIGLAVGGFALVRRGSRGASSGAATRAYLSLRRLLATRTGGVAPSVPPLEVARLYASAVPAGRLDAVEIATVYCAATFGGRPVPPEKVRDLDDRVRRLRKLA
jgi:transglutaminase-like putative cysteine protease